MKLFAGALLTLAFSTPLLAGTTKAAPVPVPMGDKAPQSTGEAPGKATGKKSDGAKARAVELTVSSVDVEGKSQRFLSSKDLVKVGAATLVDPAQDLAAGLVSVDVQAGIKGADPVWVRLAVPRGELKKVASILESDDFASLLVLIGNRIDQACTGPRQCCASDDAGACTRMCCGK